MLPWVALHPNPPSCYAGNGFSMTTVHLANLDARLAYLALQYHLARPGSELDPETKQPVAHAYPEQSRRGLAEVAGALAPQLERAVATIELSDHQRRRLISAVAGTINELKTYPLLDARPGGRDTMPAFDAALRRLFPQAEEEPEEATQLAGHLLLLRRRLERLAAAPAAAETLGPKRRPWWRFWQRGGA